MALNRKKQTPEQVEDVFDAVVEAGRSTAEDAEACRARLRERGLIKGAKVPADADHAFLKSAFVQPLILDRVVGRVTEVMGVSQGQARGLFFSHAEGGMKLGRARLQKRMFAGGSLADVTASMRLPHKTIVSITTKTSSDAVEEAFKAGTITADQRDANAILMAGRTDHLVDHHFSVYAILRGVVGELSHLTGLEPAQIRERFIAGQSPAEVAAAQGVTPEDLREAVLEFIAGRLRQASATGRITAEEPEAIKVLIARRVGRLLDTTVTNWLAPPPVRPRNSPGGPAGIGAVAKTIADRLGITVQELRKRYFRGASIAELGAANGVARDDLVNTAARIATQHIDTAVAATTTEAERGALATLVRAHIARLVDHHVGERMAESSRDLGRRLAQTPTA